MKEIFKIIIKLILVINCFKLTLSCTPSISTVSEINPFVGDVLVQITGIFCTSNSSGVNVLFNVGNEVVGCYDIVINSIGTSMLCSFSVPAQSTPKSTFNFNSFNSVLISGLLTPPTTTTTTTTTLTTTMEQITPTPAIGVSNYLYTSSVCPRGCTSNGICDIGNTCRCNEGYASFDCSTKVYNQTLNTPLLPTNNSISFVNKNDFKFYFSMTHVLATTITGSIFSQVQQVALSSMSLPQYNNPYVSSIAANSYMGSNSSSWLTNFGYDMLFSGNENDDSFTFINYKGSYLPQSSTFASILINTTINSQFSGLPSNIFNTTNGNGSFALIFEINGSDLSNGDLTWVISDSLNSVEITGDSTILVITISDLYDFNGKRVPNHATLQVLTTTQAQQLQQFSSSSIYISLNFNQQSILSVNNTLSGSYTHKLIINAYSTYGTGIVGDLKPWEIALIVVGSIVFLVILISIIIVCVRRRKHHHHHHHHHHHGHYEVLNHQNEKTPLYR